MRDNDVLDIAIPWRWKDVPICTRCQILGARVAIYAFSFTLYKKEKESSFIIVFIPMPLKVQTMWYVCVAPLPASTVSFFHTHDRENIFPTFKRYILFNNAFVRLARKIHTWYWILIHFFFIISEYEDAKYLMIIGISEKRVQRTKSRFE